MAKFIYSMQNILDIKFKLEESARQEYADARIALYQEEDKLNALKDRRNNYLAEYKRLLEGVLDFLKIDEMKNAIESMDLLIVAQTDVVRGKSKALEKARQKLESVMQERKMHEKLKEKKFEEFLAELAAAESKEVDELVSYKYSSRENTED